jgi:hypothetical protein
MRSPFPGMTPVLEQSELWSTVHSRLIVAIADNLIDQLSDNYRIEIEKRTYTSEDSTVQIPDLTETT